jgi:hypothetical protein
MTILNNGSASIKNDMAELFEVIQDQRVEFIEQVREVNLQVRSLCDAEALRLAQKLGRAHPRTQTMLARVDTSLSLLDALEIEAQIAKVRSPVVDMASAVVHGRIVEAGREGVANTGVQLVNDKGEDLGVVAVKTDEAGYYAIELKPEVVAMLGPDRKAFLSISGEKGKVVPAGLDGFAVKAGEKIIREVELNPTEVEKLHGKLDLSNVPSGAPPNRRGRTGRGGGA